MPQEITCLIVDDHEVVREGLRLSLSRAPHIRVIGEASDGSGAVALVERAGGTIWMERNEAPDTGVTVRFTLPRPDRT